MGFFSRSQPKEIEIKYQQLQGIIENLKDGLIVYDSDFKIEIFNKAAEEIFNISAPEIIGQNFTPAFVQNPKYRLLAQTIFSSLAPIVRHLSEAEVWPQVVDIILDDLALRVITNRLDDATGRLSGFFKIVQNRTRERDLLQSKSEFITIAAHQLRTPLTGISWTFEALGAETNLKPEQKELVAGGLNQTQTLLKIVNDLLEVSKIEEGKFGYRLEEINLGDFVAKILTSLEILIKQYKVKIYFDQPKEKIKVKIDPQRIEMVFNNLLDNALKYNVENGQVIVKIEKISSKPFVQISIKDTGVGIPAEEINKLFSKFYRGSNAAKIVAGGSGLGLYIVKNIIQRHGGEIWAESALGRGSTFYFTLPIDFKLIPPIEVFYEEE